MKRIFTIAGCALILLLGSAPNTRAVEIVESTDSGNSRIEANRTIEDTLITAGQRVDIRGTVTRNAIVAGQVISIDDAVGGDVIAAGQDVRINGNVTGNVIAAGASVLIAEDATVTGDILAFAGTVEVAGHVDGSVRAAGGTVTILGSVGGNVDVSTGSLLVEDGATVAGDVTGTSGSEFQPAAGATIGGAVTVTQDPDYQNRWAGSADTRAFDIGAKLFSIAMTLVLGLFFVLLLPKLTATLRNHAYAKPGQSFLAGILTFLLFFPALLLLLSLILTIPLAVLLVCTFGVLAVVGSVVSQLWLGDLLGKKQWHPLLSLLVGAVVLSVASLIPFIGGLVQFVVMLVGTGAAVALTWQWLQKSAR